MTNNVVIITITDIMGHIRKSNELVIIYVPSTAYAPSTFTVHIFTLDNGVMCIGTDNACCTSTVMTDQHRPQIYKEPTGDRNVVNVRGFVLYPVHNTRQLCLAVAMVTPVHCLGRQGQEQRAVTSWRHH